jgi:hypothetical protein
MFAVALTKFVHQIVAPTLVDARGKLTERLVTKGACVHEWCDESTRSFTPMIITAVPTTSSRDVQ